MNLNCGAALAAAGLAVTLASGQPSLAAPAAPGTGDLIIDRARPGTRPPPRRPKGSAKRQAPRATAPVIVVPFTLTRVEVTGSSLPPARLSAATAKLVGRQFDEKSVGEVIEAVQSAYVGGRIALPLVNLIEPPGSDGVVRIQVREAHVAGVNIVGDTQGDLTLVKTYAARLTMDRPLSRQTLERQLSLISDIPGLTTTVELGQGSAPYAVDMRLTLDQKRFETGFRIDNRGAASLGETQMQLTLTGYGWTRQGDQTQLVLATPPNFETFRYVALSHQQPMGHGGANLTLSAGHLVTKPEGGVVEGKATTAGVAMSWPAIRSYNTNLYISGGIDGIDSTDALLGEQIATERTRALRGGFALQRSHSKSTGSVGLVVSSGIDGLAARVQAPGMADLDFLKANLSGEYVRDLTPAVWLSVGFTIQATGDLLPASEQFAFGGGEYGRAFPAAAAMGDRGAAARMELGWRPKGLPKRVAGTELYGFVDRGWVEVLDRPGLTGGDLDLGSAGAGLRLAVGKSVVLELEGAHAVEDHRPGDRGWSANFGLSIRY